MDRAGMRSGIDECARCGQGWGQMRSGMDGWMDGWMLIFNIYTVIPPTLGGFRGELSFPRDQQVEQRPEP